MFKHISYAMVMVSDMNRSVEFYGDKLGLPLKFQSPEWTEFLTGDTTLALHGGGTAKSETGDQGKVAGTCTIGFNTDDLERTHADLLSKGVQFVMPPTRLEKEGIILAVAKDPDGLDISFVQVIGNFE